MKIISSDNNRYMLRFDRGEEVFEGLTSFAEKESITAGSFTAIGACSEIILSYYNLEKKEYQDRTITKEMEIVSVIGNVGVLNDKPAIHAHGVFGDNDLTTVGGHIKMLRVSATCEVFLTRLSGDLLRAYDEDTGLNLMT